MGQQPVGLCQCVGRIDGIEPAAHEKLLERIRQLGQLSQGQIQTSQVFRLQAVRPAGEEQPVAGPAPGRQGIGKAGEQVAPGQVVAPAFGHFVYAIENEQAAPGLELGAEHRAREPAGLHIVVLTGPGLVEPAGETRHQLLAGPPAVAGEELRMARPVPQADQQGQPPDKRIRQGLGEARVVDGDPPVRRHLPFGHAQRQPTAEGGFAGTRGTKHVERATAKVVEEEHLLPKHVERGVDNIDVLVVPLHAGHRHRRHVDVAEPEVAALLQIQPEEFHAVALAAQPVEVGGTNGVVLPVQKVRVRRLCGTVKTNRAGRDEAVEFAAKFEIELVGGVVFTREMFEHG